MHDTGVGVRITDEVIRHLYNVLAINFDAKAVEEDKYPNLISKAWFYVAPIIDQVQCEMDSDLLMEPTSHLPKMDSRGSAARRARTITGRETTAHSTKPTCSCASTRLYLCRSPLTSA